jgi:hypothetical protein
MTIAYPVGSQKSPSGIFILLGVGGRDNRRPRRLMPSSPFRFQAVIPNVAKRGHADMPNRQPALECVMAGTVEYV